MPSLCFPNVFAPFAADLNTFTGTAAPTEAFRSIHDAQPIAAGAGSLPHVALENSLKLYSIICSTRPGRVGPSVARWFHEIALRHAKFDAQLIDLEEIGLPLYDEPHHPRLQKYTKDHTKRWAAMVAAADAYVFVTPEYNYGPPPSFVNALNYVYVEWNYKPCAFVSYGGVSGGMRSVQQEKLLVTTLKMMPLVEAVAAPMVSRMIDASGNFQPNEHMDGAAVTMLSELYRWAEALRTMRA